MLLHRGALLSRGAAALQQRPRRTLGNTSADASRWIGSRPAPGTDRGGVDDVVGTRGGTLEGSLRTKPHLTTFTGGGGYGGFRRSRSLAVTAAAAASIPTSRIPTSPHVSLVQGASRGIGLEMVRQLLEQPNASLGGRPAAAGGYVVATCRDPAASAGLTALHLAYPDRLTLLALDVTDVASIEAAAAAVTLRHGRVDVLANTAAVLHVPGEMAPETSINRIDEEAMMKSFRVNAMGPVMVVKAFAPLLMEATARSGAAAEGSGFIARPAMVAILSARVSSIGDNSLGGWYSYRASKTALNQLTKNMAIEFSRKRHPVSFILLHPGTVNTGLSAPFQRNVPEGKLFTVERAATQLLEIVGAKGQEHSGMFFAWDGQEIEW